MLESGLGVAEAQIVGSWVRNRRFGGSSSRMDQSTECGLVAGEVPGHLMGTAEVLLSKALNPQLLGALLQGAAPSL